MHVSPKIVFLLLVLLCLCYFLYSNIEYDTLKPVFLIISNSSSSVDFSKKRFDKFIFPLYNDACSGIGNQMFRIASLYGIGLYPNVKRTPGMTGTYICIRDYKKEFAEIFPNVMKLVEFDVSFISDS